MESIIYHRLTLESLYVSYYDKRVKFLCVAFPKVYYPMFENECLCPHKDQMLQIYKEYMVSKTQTTNP